ncbi:phosphoadenosine phosphosulfate reductase family protein [Cytobacillus firmus]|uniref:phosphoadenosine phosphosulfate reductase domain-containing protein n=1 Tax=Cytobacillus firmus TaxID=1399 RepID=UPI00237B295C|nr:phosphoadenosine phosphosulfate reductase family protein [Cytobacillus firmus]MDD9312667.1 phosphoadenosine phosphosulfate reductase family protein [Cytobacillus firmus]
MQNHIIFFSGGKSSFSAADYVKTQFSEDNIVLYFTDTLWEDEDLYRFIYEASDKLELPMLIHSRGITPAQLMVQQKFMANNRVGTCSKELKMKVSSQYLKKGIVPEVEKWHNKQFLKAEDFITGAILYFGIGFEEMHREGPIRANWKPFEVKMPLIENIIDNDAILARYGIRQPRMYDMQFSHNNCKGRCVKAGQGHFKNLLMKDEKTFIELMEQEIIISEYIRYCKQPAIKSGKLPDRMYKDVWEFVSSGRKSEKILNILSNTDYLKSKRRLLGEDNKGQPINKAYTFMKTLSLEELEKQPIQCDIWDIGGCGCFVEYEANE